MSCNRNEVSPSPESGPVVSQSTTLHDVEMRLQETHSLGGLTLQLQKVEDSRCPMNAMCIRQGSAVTTFLVKDAQGQSATKQLYLGEALLAPNDRGNRSADTVTVALGDKNYQLILRDVHPYPNTSDANPPAKTVKVAVRSL